MSAKKRKSWAEKLRDAKGLPKVEPIPEKLGARWGCSGTMVIPSPLEVDEIMRSVPKGRLITINEIRRAVARRHGATVGCPITCGIFAWIAAHAAEEVRAAGGPEVTPWWRTLKSGGQINEKYPGGVAAVKKLLEAEGHTVVAKGKRHLVADYEKFLIEP